MIDTAAGQLTTIKFPILCCPESMGVGYNTPNTVGKMARISRATARRLYDAGVEVVIVAHKFMPYPDAANGVAMRMNKARDEAQMLDSESGFDKIARNYAWYNCTWETGYYPAFWVRFETYHTYRERHRDCFEGVARLSA